MRVGVLGASGTIGSRIVKRLAATGHAVRAQSRDSSRLQSAPEIVEKCIFDPRDEQAIAAFVGELDAVVFALGESQSGPTTLFSDITRKLVAQMEGHGVRRLVAITGVGAGDTRGHGGWLYDWIVFPLFTRHRYADKDRQEALIAASALDWIIVRPASFRQHTPPGDLQVITEIGPETRLSGVSFDEVADFVVAQLRSDDHLRKRPFIGHA